MTDAVFSQVPTVHATLKLNVPQLDDNTIRITLKNERQLDDFSIKKQAVLQYLRSHFEEGIDDVVAEVDTEMETQRYILDDKDKLDELRVQNPDITDFIKVLNLRIRS